MGKIKLTKEADKIPNNLVAKHANKFNKAAVFADKKNDYQRKPKHTKKGMFSH